MFLQKVSDLLEKWQTSRRAGFTDPTFTAWIQTLRALSCLCSDLLNNCDFKYVLTGKLLSDPLEARFGCYRQMSGANYLLSVKQLFESEKKIRVLNKLVDLKNALDNDFDVPEHFPCFMQNCSTENVLINELHEVCSIEEASREEQNIVFYVAGFIGRSISRRNHCDNCKNILLTDDQVQINIDHSDFEPTNLSDSDRRTLFDMANRGGLSSPSEYCFHICLVGFLYFSQIFNSDSLTKKFLACHEHEKIFVEALSLKMASSNSCFTITDPVCASGHNFRRQMFVKLYHCFIKNFLRRVNHVPCVNAGRKIKKLTSKSAK